MESAQTMMRAGDAFLPWMTDLLVEVVQTMISATGRHRVIRDEWLLLYEFTNCET